MYTCWIPLVNQCLNNGTLGICAKSHLLDFEQDEMDDFELPKAYEGIQEQSEWYYANSEMGDVIIFDIRSIHGSFINQEKSFRINCDTRWYVE